MRPVWADSGVAGNASFPGRGAEVERPERHERSRAVRVAARSGGFADSHVAYARSGAILFSRSLQKLATLDAGFTQNGVLELDLDLTALHLPAEGRAEFKGFVVQQVRAIPGVESAAEAGVVPLSGNGMNRQVLVAKGGQVVEGRCESER